MEKDDVRKTKILILTAPAGNGHNAMSNALKSRLEESGAEVLIYDVFKPSPLRIFVVGKFYFWAARYFLRPTNRMYERMKRRDITKTKNTRIHSMANKKMHRKAEAVIKDFAPDAIFCAHTAAAFICSELKSAQKLPVPVFNIVSDYDVPPYLECCAHVDYHICPSPDMDGDILRRGIRPEQILHFGIPVQTKFSRVLDKAEARRVLGLREDVFTVMVMNGGVGFGDPLGTIKSVFASVPAGSVQIVTVCGHNEKLKKRIDKYGKTRSGDLLNYGFATNVDQIMSASDLLIGKIGGVAITEAFNKRVCILASTSLPWQEYDNMLFLTKRGACGYIKKPSDAGAIVAEYISKPDVLDAMREKMESLRKPDATEKITDALIAAANKKDFTKK